MSTQSHESGNSNQERLINDIIQGLNYRGAVWRGDAIKALVEIDNDIAIPIVFRILRVDESTHVRSVAVAALGNIGDESITPQLTQVLMEDNNRAVRACAAKALSKLMNGTPGVSQPLLQALLEDIYIQGSSLAYEAAQALKDIGNIDTPTLELIKILERYYSNHQHEKPYHHILHLKTIDALGILGDARAIPVLLKALLDPRSICVYKALKALEKIENIDNQIIISGLLEALEYYKKRGRESNCVDRHQMVIEVLRRFGLDM